VIAAGGIEDHALDRSEGFFGHVDSYVTLYRVHRESPQNRPTRLTAVNVSAEGVLTPKWIGFAGEGGSSPLVVTGYGGERILEIEWSQAPSDPVRLRSRAAPPGLTSLARRPGGGWMGADPLLDAWVAFDETTFTLVNAEPIRDERSSLSRLGEVLAFTGLMAPDNTSEGARSRFSCEACHFEGGVDGRVHYTGRDDVFASTKPLFGLFNNTPLFTRALDPDVAVMTHSEFRVAGAGSDGSSWFTLTAEGRPWLEPLLGEDAAASPETLRRALVAFFRDFTHPANPAALARDAFTPAQRQGAESFDRHCAGCHAPRLVTEDPASAVAFAGWESLVLGAAGPIVWASEGHRQTGVTPYVHAEGARTPSLRRVSSKHPYFTNGSANSLREVLERVRLTDEGLLHQAPAGVGRPLSPAEQGALLAFLQLL
jgi:hypothetical protein